MSQQKHIETIYGTDGPTVKLELVTLAETAKGDRILPAAWGDRNESVNPDMVREVTELESLKSGDLWLQYKSTNGSHWNRTMTPETAVYRIIS